MRPNSKKLFDLTDEKLYNYDEALENIKNCFSGKKACIFSCGYNIHEHKDKFEILRRNDDFVIISIKSAITFLDLDVDIHILTESNNNYHLYNQRKELNNVFKVRKNDEQYVNITDFDIKNLNIFEFLKHLGFIDIYLFGFFLVDKLFSSLENYNYYDDIICNKFHWYENGKGNNCIHYRSLELGIISEYLFLYKLSQDKQINLYNLSRLGSLPNTIPRITFDDIFGNNKTFIKPNYLDINQLIEKEVDLDFYFERYGKNDKNINDKKEFFIKDFFIKGGYFLLKKVNKNDKKKEILFEKFEHIRFVVLVIIYLIRYPYDLKKKYYSECKFYLLIFFSHYVLLFNKLFDVCLYNDFDKICNLDFYNNLYEENKIVVEKLFKNENHKKELEKFTDITNDNTNIFKYMYYKYIEVKK